MKDRYLRLFQIETGKKFGEFMEETISRICGFSEGSDGCDRQFQDLRVECKAMRCTRRVEDSDEEVLMEMLETIENNTMESRALYSVKESVVWGTNPAGEPEFEHLADQACCQQVKPVQFDYLVAVTVYLDMMRVFIIPSSDISPRVQRHSGDQLVMTPQHGNPDEGVLTLGKIADYHAFDIEEPISLLDELQVDVTPFMRQAA